MEGDMTKVYRKRLHDLRLIRSELARIYSDYLQGKIETSVYRALVFGLRNTADVEHLRVQDEELVKQLDEIRTLIENSTTKSEIRIERKVNAN